MSHRSNEHQVGPLAWVLAASIIVAVILGSVFVTNWKPMRRAAVVQAPGLYPSRPASPVAAPPMRLPATLEYGGAIAAYHARDYAAAARQLDAISRARPGNRDVEFFLGVSRLLAGDARGALDPLAAAVRLSSGDSQREAERYLAIAQDHAR